MGAVVGGGEVNSLDKSVFFCTRKGFGYGYGEKFRDPNSPRIDNRILKVKENFETIGRRNAPGVIDIHADDLLIAGSDFSIAYISKTMKGNSMLLDMEKTKRPIWAWNLKKRVMMMRHE